MKISIPSGKFQLSAWINEVPDSEKLAVLLPGFLDTKDYAHMTILGEDLAKVGYTSVSFDPTGTWESVAGGGNIRLFYLSISS